MNKHVIAPALGLFAVGALSLSACSGGSTADSAAALPRTTTPAASTPSVATPVRSAPAASTSPAPVKAPASNATATPKAVAPVPSTAPTTTHTSAAAPVRGTTTSPAEGTYLSSCDRLDGTQVPVRLHGGTAVLPHRSELRLDTDPGVTQETHLGDGHTYRMVTLECLPPAGASHSQLFVYLADPGTSPRLLGEPIKVTDQKRITSTGSQDEEGLVVSAEGWSAKAPSAQPDQSWTYFITVSPRGIGTVVKHVQPLTR